MIKKLLDLNDYEMKIFNYSARPFIICCLFIVIIVFVGNYFGTLSSNEITGFAKSITLYAIINYLNIAYIDLKNTLREED